MSKYVMVRYIGGAEVARLETDDYRKARAFYLPALDATCAVRVWLDGKRLLYAQSNALFGGEGFNNRPANRARAAG